MVKNNIFLIIFDVRLNVLGGLNLEDVLSDSEWRYMRKQFKRRPGTEKKSE